jgi:hypothetical protein
MTDKVGAAVMGPTFCEIPMTPNSHLFANGWPCPGPSAAPFLRLATSSPNNPSQSSP